MHNQVTWRERLVRWLDRQLGTNLTYVGNRLTVVAIRKQRIEVAYNGEPLPYADLLENDSLTITLPLLSAPRVRIVITEEDIPHG